MPSVSIKQTHHQTPHRMKVLKLSLLALTAFVGSLTASAQTADEIIEKHVAAVGGADNWKKVNSVFSEGKMTVQGAEVLVTTTVLNGKGSRQDLSVMGMTGYQIVTPTAGWSFMPFAGQTAPEAVTEDVLKESADQYDAQGAFIDYKAKGHTVEYLGKEDIEGTEAHKLRVTHKSGKVETVFIDPASFYILRSVSKQKANGQEMEFAVNMSNYTKLPEGIVVPMNISMPFGEIVITKVEVNKPVDENIFKPGN